MPELPDVENYKRYLDATALHKRIEAVHVDDARFVRDASADALREALVGRTFEATRRHGKHLLIALDVGGGWLATHYGMTGALRYFKVPEKAPDHTRVRLDFDNGYHLAFISRRMLGHVRLIDDADTFIEAEGLGTDPFDPKADRAWFHDALGSKRGGLKSALMDQGLIAGLGNVYSDEILFHARIHPATKVQDLDTEQTDRLFRSMHAVLDTAVACGAGSDELFDRLPEDFLLRHREKGAPCPRCGAGIETIKVSGRTAHLCPRCQPL